MKKDDAICNMDCLNCIYPDCINTEDDPVIRKREYFRMYWHRHPERYEAHKKRMNELRHKRYFERKAAGLCVICGKVPAVRGARCEACAEKISMYEKAKRRSVT